MGRHKDPWWQRRGICSTQLRAADTGTTIARVVLEHNHKFRLVYATPFLDPRGRLPTVTLVTEEVGLDALTTCVLLRRMLVSGKHGGSWTLVWDPTAVMGHSMLALDIHYIQEDMSREPQRLKVTTGSTFIVDPPAFERWKMLELL